MYSPDIREAVIAAAKEGQTASQIFRGFGVGVQTVSKWAAQAGVPMVKHRRDPNPARDQRTSKMVTMYQHGCTLHSIGTQFGLTRERVRQILSKHGVTASDGGAHVVSQIRRGDKEARREAKSLREFGLSYEVVSELRRRGVLKAYREQVRNASMRAIDWRLTFPQWFAVWQTSGKLHLRGRGKGKYVMSRITDTGPYALGNVHIQLAVENSREASAKWAGKTKTNRGVFLLFPGTNKPWLSKFGDKSLGYYSTEEEAVAAREAYFAENPEVRRQGRGYAITGTKEKPRYQVMVSKAYVGTFKTPEAALAARELFIASQLTAQEISHV